MTRYFCDACGDEIPENANLELRGKVRVGKCDVAVEVLSGNANVNAPLVCYRCVIVAIMHMANARIDHLNINGKVYTKWELDGKTELPREVS